MTQACEHDTGAGVAPTAAWRLHRGISAARRGKLSRAQTGWCGRASASGAPRSGPGAIVESPATRNAWGPLASGCREARVVRAFRTLSPVLKCQNDPVSLSAGQSQEPIHAGWFRALQRSIREDYERIRQDAQADPQRAGHRGEGTWARVLEKWLPPAYGVVTRKYIVPEIGNDAFETDIVVLHPSYPAPLRRHPDILAGGVASAFSVKVTLARCRRDSRRSRSSGSAAKSSCATSRRSKDRDGRSISRRFVSAQPRLDSARLDSHRERHAPLVPSRGRTSYTSS